EHQAERGRDAIGARAATDVQEVGGLTAGVLDHVHGGHGESGAVDDAADVPVQRHVVEPVLRGLHFAGVLLGVVAQLGDVGPPEHRIVVEAHLHVQREHPAVLGDDERVDLDHRGVELAEGAIGPENRRHGLVHLGARETQAERQLACLESLHPDRGLDFLAQDRRRLALRDFFDLHAAVRVRHHHDPLALAVEHQADVQLPLDRRRLLDQQAMYRETLGAGLYRHERLAQQVFRGLADVRVGRAELHPARLAAGPGVDLRLHDPAGAADFARPIDGLLGTVRDAALGNGDAEAREQLLGLVLVDVHGYARVVASAGAPAVRAAMAAAIWTMFWAIRAE